MELEEGVDTLLSLLGDTAPRWSLENYCGAHAQQLAFCRDRSPWIHVMCARQSGKSKGAHGMLLDNALTSPRSTNVFLGLTSKGVKFSQWFPAWKPLLDHYGIQREDNETDKLTTFPNGSRVVFGGTDDLSHIRTYLGNRLADSVFVIDECQDQADQMLRYILGTLLPPMLTPTSRVVCAGVLPDLEVGYFLELATAAGWSHHEWGRAANVHTPEAMEQLRAYMAQHGLTEDDPQIARDWFMRRVWRKDATGYHYDRARNGYKHTPAPWQEDERQRIEADFEKLGKPLPVESFMAAIARPDIEFVSVAIDPGGRDRTSLVANGWGRASPKVQHLFEWVTPRNSLASLAQIGAVAGIVQKHYGPSWWHWDAPGKLEIDTWGRDYGIPTVQAARKADFPGQVRRVNDMLAAQALEIMIGSSTETDMQRARWDKKARADGRWLWDRSWHPDPAEGSRYALAPYWDATEPTETPERAAYLANIRRAEEQSRKSRAAVGEYDGDEFQDDLYSDVGV